MSSYPALAVVACDGDGRGAVLWYLGLWDIIDEAGVRDLDVLGLDDAPHGITVWEGELVWDQGTSTPDGPAEPDFDLVGTFRDPTDEEWAEIRLGGNPFERLRCQHMEAQGFTYDTPDGQEAETWDMPCGDVAVHDKLCARHWRELRRHQIDTVVGEAETSGAYDRAEHLTSEAILAALGEDDDE